MARLNGFSEGDTAIIEKLAWAIGDKILERVEKRIDEKVFHHRLSCTNRINKKLLAVVAAISAGIGAGGAMIVAFIKGHQ